MRPGIPLPILGVLAILLAAPGCRKQAQIGHLTQFQKGGAGGGAGGGVDGGGGASGVVELKALFGGALFGRGNPDVGQFGPASAAQGTQASGAALTTPVVAVFSESMDPKTLTDQTFTLRESGGGGGGGGIFGGIGGGETVGAAVGMDPKTAYRVAVLLPLQPLKPATEYTARLADTVTDLEGNLLQKSGSEAGSTPGTSFTFRTVTNPADSPFEVIAAYPPPGSQNAGADTVIQLYFSIPVATGGAGGIDQSGNVQVKLAGGGFVAGKVKALDDPRVVRFKPTQALPQGATVEVMVRGGPTGVKSAEVPVGGQPLTATMTDDYKTKFTVSSVPTPSLVKLLNNQPLIVGAAAFDGRLTTENLKSFPCSVKVPGGNPGADSVTVLFFQEKGGSSTAGRAFKKNLSGGSANFDVDLSKGGKDAAFIDTNSVAPPRSLLIGAFASRGALNSPVGPVDLPEVFVKTSLPQVTLGPPTDPEAPYEVRTVLSEPAVYGTASEAITSFRAVVNATSFPSTFDAIALSGAQGVTDQNLFFITERPVAAIPGTELGSGPKFLPLMLDELRFKDFVGNEVVLKPPETGAIHFEGSIGGALGSGASERLRVRVVREENLKPVKNADVQITRFPYNPADVPVVRSTGQDGEAVFSHAELTGFGNFLMLTADKKNFDLVTLAGFRNPALFATSFGVSVIVAKTDAERARLVLETQNDVPIQIAASAVLAAASGVGIPAKDKQGQYQSRDFADSRFFLRTLATGATSRAFVDVAKNRPHVVSTFEHDGGGTYLAYPTPVLASADDATIVLDYEDVATNVTTTVAHTVVVQADVTAAGIFDDPIEVTRARLVGRIPGLPGVLPLSFSPDPVDPADPVFAALFAPIPETLWRNEIAPELDPAYELLIQPDAALGILPPSDALFEETFRLEVEAADVASSALTRHRALLDFTAQVEARTTGADPVDLPVVPLVAAIHHVHPASLTIDIDDGGSPDMVPADSLYRVTLTSDGSPRSWTALVSAEVLTTGPGPVTFSFPGISSEPFGVPGTFKIVAESIEFESGQFDFDSFTFADVERLHRRLSRSLTMPIVTTP